MLFTPSATWSYRSCIADQRNQTFVHLRSPETSNLNMQLVIQNLSKTYGNGVKALDNVSLTIPTGMFGLLGPNGAGKSTLMRLLPPLQQADAGRAMLGHLDVLKNKEAVRKVLGYLPQEFGVYPRVSAYQMLDHIALLKGVMNGRERKELVEALLQKVNLWEHRKRKIAGFSGGMKQRFGIAQSLIGEPKLIIVDEPTAGLDPGERNRFYNLLTEIGENVVVILSTHIVQDVQELCSNMAIINKGKLLFFFFFANALMEIDGKVWEKTITKAELEHYANSHALISNKLVAGKPVIHVLGAQAPADGFTRTAPTLEDVFFSHITSASVETPFKMIAKLFLFEALLAATAMVYIFLLLLGLMCGAAVAVDNFRIAAASERIPHAPEVIYNFSGIMSFLACCVTAFVTNCHPGFRE